MNEKRWQGIGASSGYTAGKTWLLHTMEFLQRPKEAEPASINSQHELSCLQKAIERTDQAIGQYEAQVRAEKGEELAQIFAAHRLLLSDPAFVGAMSLGIQDKMWTAVKAVQQVSEEAVAMLSALDDPYLRERVVDIQDVSRQLIQNLADKTDSADRFPASGNWIVVAEELTPAQTISLPKERVLGFIVHKGGPTSHAAILARTYGIPAVVGLRGDWEEVAGLAGAALDGDQGWVRALSSEDIHALQDNAAKLPPVINDSADDLPVYTGMTLAANIGNPADLPLVKRFKAQGVGLYRTEFLFMGDSLPTEEEQIAAYTAVISACSPNVTVIRTLDIGGDKKAPALGLPEEKNPFLGVRALRLCFRKPEIFHTQLRAVWRASAAGPTAVMFPMIAAFEELLQAKMYLEQAKNEVIREGHVIGDLQVGMMVEVPAAVWIAPKLAQEIDFFSIGTNDLTQYSLAVDRENSEVADLYQPYHPAVLGMIAQVAQAAKQAGIWLGICGESGGDGILAPFFAGLGIDELSMSPGLLPKMRQALAGLDAAAIQQARVVERILDCATAAEVLNILRSYGKMER